MQLTEKQKNCPYCHGMMDMVQAIPGNKQTLTIVEGNNGKYAEVLYQEDGHPNMLIYIDYCPACGRPLNEE